MEEGIMGLNPQMGMPQTQNMNQGPRPEDIQAFEQMRQQVSPKEFSDTTLDSAMAEDPELVGAFKEILQGAEMPQELVMALKQLIQAVLSDPSMYPQLVQALIELGADAEDIPPQFDPSFVSTLALALEEVSVSQPMPEEVQTFSKGGEVSMKPIAKYMASLGRGGDTMLAHINPDEARLLKALGGAGTINPHTGLPEFFIKKLFKGVKNAVKGVVKGVKKFAKSKIGRLITTVAFAYFAGPAAANFLGAQTLASQAAVTAFVGSAGSGLVAGDGLKNSITSGLKSAAIAGVVAPGISAAMGDPSQGTFLQRYKSGFQEGSGFLGGQENLLKQQEQVGQAADGQNLLTKDDQNFFSDIKARQDLAMKDSGSKFAKFVDPNNPTEYELLRYKRGGDYASSVDRQMDNLRRANALEKSSLGDSYADEILPKSTRGLPAYSPKKPYGEMFKEDFYPDVKEGIQNIVGAPFSKDLTYREGFSRLGSAATGAPFTTAALGLGALQAGGYFTPEAPSPYDLYGIDMRRGYDLYNKDPSKYMIPLPRPGIRYADGGIAQNFPRKNGAINGPGTGTSDDIPAMLSDGEFVFTAKAVRNAGGGDRKEGANKMYSMMKSLERMG